MIADRFEIIDDGHLTIAIRHGANTLYIDELEDEFAVAAIRQQSRDIASRDAVIVACAKAVGASVSPECSDEFRAMLPGEIRALVDQLRTDLAAAVAERDSYRDEFSGLCHALSVGSEGRPEMTAADWRKRVDDGVEFLLRPLIAHRDELVAAYEFARHIVRDDPRITPRGALIRQSDEIGRLRARLAALESESATMTVGAKWPKGL